MENTHFDIWKSDLKSEIEPLYLRLPSYTYALKDIKPIMQIEMHLNITKKIIEDLRIIVEPHIFLNEKDEIFFFKYIKPLFCGAFIYWKRLLSLYIHAPVGGQNIIRKYYKGKLRKLKSFFDANIGLYEYIRGNYEYLDSLYFLRSSKIPNKLSDPLSTDLKLTTAKDLLVSEMFANDLLEQHITGLLKSPLKESDQHQKTNNLKWTGPRIGMIELIYALQSSGLYNNGQVEIKELAETFQQLFQIDLGNYYHAFNEIRLRKKNRTNLLDQMREKVIQKMDAMDER